MPNRDRQKMKRILTTSRGSLGGTAKVCLALCANLALVLAVLLVAIGLLKMYLSVVQLIGIRVSLADLLHAFLPQAGAVNIHDAREDSAVAYALDGLECIFLAPLAFLLIRGIHDFVEEVIDKGNERKLLTPESSRLLARTKVLIIGLMIAVVSTDLVRRSLSDKGLSYEQSITSCLFIFVLSTYAIMSEKLHHEHAQMPPKIEQPLP